jgi:tetratricopeptide (TPR) repeat protein
MMLKNSSNAWYFLNQGLTAVYYNNFKKSISNFNKAISLDPDNLIAQLHKGTTLYKMKDFQQALD